MTTTNANPNQTPASPPTSTTIPVQDCARCPNTLGVVATLGKAALLCEECAVERLLQPKGAAAPPPNVILQLSADALSGLLTIAYEEGKVAAMPPELDAPAAAPPNPLAPPVAPLSPPSTPLSPPSTPAPPPSTPAPLHNPNVDPNAKACKLCDRAIKPQYTYCIEHRPPLCGQCGKGRLGWNNSRGDWFDVCYNCRSSRQAA